MGGTERDWGIRWSQKPIPISQYFSMKFQTLHNISLTVNNVGWCIQIIYSVLQSYWGGIQEEKSFNFPRKFSLTTSILNRRAAKTKIVHYVYMMKGVLREGLEPVCRMKLSSDLIVSLPAAGMIFGNHARKESGYCNVTFRKTGPNAMYSRGYDRPTYVIFFLLSIRDLLYSTTIWYFTRSRRDCAHVQH